MGCTDVRPKKQGLGAFKQIELRLLLKMYTDVAIRSSKELVTKENFYIFFHINGLWGQEIFDRFDRDKSGLLTFDEFKFGVEQLVKGSFRKKVQALFEFYDIDKTGSISYGELLKMLYSYPKEQLKEMMQDPNFLKSMDKHERDIHFGKIQLDEAIIQEVIDESEDQPSVNSNRRRRNSDQIVDNAFILTPETSEKKYQAGFGDSAKNAKGFGGGIGDFTSKHSHKFTNLPPIKKKHAKSVVRGGSMSYAHQKHFAKRKMRITSNISLLVKKFASYLFHEQKLDTAKDNLNPDQFAKIIEGHEKIFASYFEGFHNYIWQVPADVPEFITNTSWIEGNCIQLHVKHNQKQHRYLRFYKNTIFVFKSKTKIQPEYIKNMEGLFVEEFNLEEEDHFGFIVKHRDGIYPQYAFLFPAKQEQADWLRQLSGFRKVSILDQYTIEQKIGAGNFSIVYKGVDKKSGQLVAIKSIEKFKLSVAEKEVIKHECEILRFCVHPTIVKFIQKSETKTHMYIITELMNEGDLDEYVKTKTFLEEYEASIIMKQLIESLLFLNSLGLIHRDLKPENIMLRKSKDKDMVQLIKLIDFGFAVYKTAIKTLPQREKYVGTPNFVAPQVLQTKQYDQRIDNFSIGVIMYFMLSGSLPFDSPFQDEIARNTVECNYTLDNAHWSNITDNGKELISKLLCPRQERISLQEAIRHPWITHYLELKAMVGSNKKGRYL